MLHDGVDDAGDSKAMASIEARVDALSREIAIEIRLMEAMLAQSSASRTASASALVSAMPVRSTSRGGPSPPSDSLSSKSNAMPTAVAYPLQSSPEALQDRTGDPLALSPPSASSPIVIAPVAATHIEGTLFHLVRSGGLFGAGGTQNFVPHYIVVSGDSGISWYASKADYLQQPQRPLGHAAFWVETYNSRGSRFKKAAVCWPLILPEDCPAATDPTKTYFAVDYYNSGGGREQLVLAASSPEERDRWVQLLTKYVDLYLAPREESEELQRVPRGAAVPMHRSGVMEGEAPGGPVL